MKKTLLLTLIIGAIIKGYCQPQILNPTFPSSVDLFDLFEVSFTMGAAYPNPYDPNDIAIYAIFVSPNDEVYTVNAFYYEDYSFQKVNGYEQATAHQENNCWKIRFTPTHTGNWKFRIIAKDSSGAMAEMPNNGPKNYVFTCTSTENALGFISKANSRFLKRDVVINGQRQFRSFFPVGPNVSWYSCKVDNSSPPYSKPYGIYEYKTYIDSLENNANYMRIFLSQYEYLSLYGPEYTQFDNNGQPVVYFGNTINQKDSAELDYIINYAKEHGVTIMPCIFNYTNFSIEDTPTSWSNNPFNSYLETPCDFFTDLFAFKTTKNLIRYIISRWGYATNIMSWEFFNEVNNMINYDICDRSIEQDIRDWHNKMVGYVTGIDPFHHCITTSIGNTNSPTYIYSILYNYLDFVPHHNYQHIQKAKSKEQFSYILYSKACEAHIDYPSHPFFISEFGFGQGGTSPHYSEKDPFGFDLHNSLWSSTFSTSIGPASFWWWYYLRSKGLFCRYRPILHFCENLPILSATFTPNQTGHVDGHKLVFENNLETYYMINAAEDSIYGWSQDTAFAYQSLRWLTDYVIPNTFIFVTGDNGVFDPLGYVYTKSLSKRPQPSSNSNVIEIPITNQPIGSRYRLTWYDSETGYPLTTNAILYTIVQLNAVGDKVVSFNFPSSIRDLQYQTINNVFGDVVFSLVLDNLPSDSQQ